MMFTQTPRDVFMVIAESSLKKYALIGFFAKLQHSIPVYRREDYAFKGVGEVSLIKKGKDFFVVGNVGGQNVKEGDIIEFLGTINDKGEGVQVTVIELANSVLRVKINAEELPDNFDFLSPEPIEYFNFKVLPKIDQSQSYHSIYGVLARGDWLLLLFQVFLTDINYHYFIVLVYFLREVQVIRLNSESLKQVLHTSVFHSNKNIQISN